MANPLSAMSNNPWQNSPFSPGPPSHAPWEMGPELYASPYNGHTQTAHINTALPPPPWESGPIAVPPGGPSVIP